jgi:hypothetical protein
MLPLIIGDDAADRSGQDVSDAEEPDSGPSSPPRPDVEDADYTASTIHRRANA